MKRCVITGAASGIGRSLAAAYIAEGSQVIGVDRDEAGLVAAARELGESFSFIQTDLGNREALGSLTTQLAARRPLDIFIHSAGINHVGAFAGSDLSRQRTVLEVNLNAPLFLTAHLLRNNLLERGSSLVFISSLSHFVGYPGAAVYAASKSGLAAYARSLSVGLAPQEVHVLSVYPGPTRTPHAAKYSPDNSAESRRMPPDVLAGKIVRAVRAKRPVLVPGFSNKVMALAGRLAPDLTGRVMRRVILDKLSR